jgi:hypothetical protein
LIPFTDQPASLQIQSDSYPTAAEDGILAYGEPVDLNELSTALEDRFGAPLVFSRRVVFVHGAPDGTELPDSVQSLEGVPAAATLPIACAELRSEFE